MSKALLNEENQKNDINDINEIIQSKQDNLNDSTDSIVQPPEINPNSQLKMDILKSFGADLNTPTRDNILFINKALLYPCGRHLSLKDLSYTSESNIDSHKNEQLFIFLENDIKEINCLNVSKDSYLLIVTTENLDHSEISVYNLSKISFNSFTIFKPRRKVLSTQYKKFIHATFTQEGNIVCALGENDSGKMELVVYEIQNFKKFTNDNYTPKFKIDVPQGANKISFLNNKIFCISGKNCLSFWILYENSCKEFISSVNLVKNYVDHVWISDPKSPTLGAITDSNELFIYHAIFYKNNTNNINNLNDEDLNQPIERFAIRQSLTNIFNLTTVKENLITSEKFNTKDNNSLSAQRIISYEDGLIIGSNKGNILFLEKKLNGEYTVIRYSLKENKASVVGICLENINNQNILVAGFDSNEIGYINLNSVLTNIKNPDYNISLNYLCDGFHKGPITSMDISLQRPIIITYSKYDNTIRVWNYLTGHCENCKIVLEEKEDAKDKDLNFLSIAIHPNGYYVAISDSEMIRFFHLCYKELRFYGNDQVGNEHSKANCNIIKFSVGGNLLAAASERKIYIIRSFSRETLKVFNTPHKGKIVNIYFHDEDKFLYSCGSDGFVIQYNLFNFDSIKLSNKLNTYNDSTLCRNYVKINKYKQKIAQINNIISVGYSPSGDYIISNLKFESDKIEEISQVKYTFGTIKEHGVSLCHMHTKRYEIQSVAVGTLDGKVALYSKKIENEDEIKDNNNSQAEIPLFDVIHSHSSRVNFIFFSRDTNLLFSGGGDGNIFIYAVYEYPDGECATFDDNRIVSVGQINSILDEGLGDHVLMSLNEIKSNEEKMRQQNDQIIKLKKTADESHQLFEKQLGNKIDEINSLKDKEISELTKKIVALEGTKSVLMNDYEKKLEENLQEHRKKFNEREANTNIKLEELHKEIDELQNLNKNMKMEYDKKLKDENENQIHKFKELEFFLKKNVDIINKKNEKLEKDREEAKNNEIKKMRLSESEHENELKLKQEKFNEIMLQNQQEMEEKINIIAKLNEKISKLEKSISSNESSIKQYIEENKFLLENVTKLRAKLDMRESEKESLSLKLNILEENYQKKSKLENFSNQLKNELYKKNYELSAKFQSELQSREELTNTSKALERQLEETINLLINREREIYKNKQIIEKCKEDLESSRKSSILAKKEFETLLRTIYDTFQTNDKKDILIGIREIYKKYISKNAKMFNDKGKIEINVRIELEKQIEHLQNELDRKKEMSIQKGKTQEIEYRKKMEENENLIKEMSKIKKINIEMSNQIKNLKYRNITLSQTVERFKNAKKNKFNSDSNIINNININNKDSIKLNEEDNNNINNYNQNISTTIANNQSNLIFQSSYSIQNSNMSTDNNANNIKSTNNILIPNNSSISTLPSDALPLINMNHPRISEGTLRNMKNRIYKPWDKKVLTREKLLKFDEMKKIIEGKNDMIQRLITENDFLKKNFGINNKSKSTNKNN